MRTGEFIRMLQQADPTGEGFIMMSDGGVPQRFEQLPGYYDGSYSYIDEDGRLVISRKENKVDVRCKEREWVIWDDMDWLVEQDMAVAVEQGIPYHFDDDQWFQRCKEMFIFESAVPEDYKVNFFAEMKREFDRWRSYRVKADKEWIDRTLKEHADGIRFFEYKEKQDGYRRSFMVDANGKRDNLCGGTIKTLFYSGAFRRIEHDGKLWEWVPAS